MTHELLKASTRSLSMKLPMGFVSSLTQPSPKAMIASLGRSVFPSRLASPSQQISPNEDVCLTSHGRSSRTVKLRNGACANFKAHLEDSGYHWELKTWRSVPILSRHASVFIIYVHGWWGSITLRMCMYLYGAKGPATGFGKGSKASCSLINENMIGSRLFTFKRSGTRGPALLSIPCLY